MLLNIWRLRFWTGYFMEQRVTLHTLEVQLQETTNLALEFGNFLSVVALVGSL